MAVPSWSWASEANFPEKGKFTPPFLEGGKFEIDGTGLMKVLKAKI